MFPQKITKSLNGCVSAFRSIKVNTLIEPNAHGISMFSSATSKGMEDTPNNTMDVHGPVNVLLIDIEPKETQCKLWNRIYK